MKKPTVPADLDHFTLSELIRLEKRLLRYAEHTFYSHYLGIEQDVISDISKLSDEIIKRFKNSKK